MDQVNLIPANYPSTETNPQLKCNGHRGTETRAHWARILSNLVPRKMRQVLPYKIQWLLRDRDIFEKLSWQMAKSRRPVDRQKLGSKETLMSDLSARQEFPKTVFEATDGSKIIIVDIGAQDLVSEDHVYSPLQRAGQTYVIGFEPLHDETNTPRRVDRDVLMLNHYVGSGGPSNFYITEFDPASSLYEPNQEFLSQFVALPKMCTTVSTDAVQTTRLDDVPEILDCDYLKIDVQGGELDVLEGAKNLLDKVIAIHCEVEFAPVYKNQPLFADIDILLRSMGFELIDLTNGGYNRYTALPAHPSTGSRLLWAEAIYFKNPNAIGELNSEKLLKAAYIAHVNHGMYDLAARFLIEYDRLSNSSTHAQYSIAHTQWNNENVEPRA